MEGGEQDGINFSHCRFRWRNRVLKATYCYALSTAIILAGVAFGKGFVVQQSHPNSGSPGVTQPLRNWDGVWYSRIAKEGYAYNSGQQSSIAFFPAYPLLGRILANITGLAEEVALILLSNVCFFVFLVILQAYVEDQPSAVPGVSDWTMLALCIWPTSFFFRVAYGESLFVLTTLLFLYGVRRKWTTLALALVVGFATSCRPVGVALIPALAWVLLSRRKSGVWQFGKDVAVLCLSAWGILAFMAYQQFAFGEPFAFTKAQEGWAVRPAETWPDRLASSIILEPLWSKYQEGSVAYWARFEPVDSCLFSLEFANPLYFCVTVGLVAYGIYCRRLTPAEGIVAAFLLAIPYFSHGQRAMMTAQARYALSVLPAFLVVGRVLAAMPQLMASLACATSGFFLGIYAALFASWYRFY